MGSAQAVATRGIAIKTEPRCKICSSPHRGEIEDFLARQAGGEDWQGERVSQRWIIAKSEEMWGMRLMFMNLQRHGENHFKIGDPELLATGKEGDGSLLLQRASRKGEIEKGQVDDFLEEIVGIGRAKAKLMPEAVTIDHALKAAAELTKRRQDESEERRMVLAGAGLARALGVAEKAIDKLPPHGVTVEVQPLGDIEDAEVVGDQ